MKKSKKDGESILTNCSMVVLLKIWMTLPFSAMNYNYMRRISEFEVKEALKGMKSRKAVGPDRIRIEVWRCLGEVSVR